MIQPFIHLGQPHHLLKGEIFTLNRFDGLLSIMRIILNQQAWSKVKCQSHAEH